MESKIKSNSNKHSLFCFLFFHLQSSKTELENKTCTNPKLH